MIRFVRVSDACQRLGLGRSTIYRLVKEGVLPPLVKIAGNAGMRSCGFVEHELEAC